MASINDLPIELALMLLSNISPEPDRSTLIILGYVSKSWNRCTECLRYSVIPAVTSLETTKRFQHTLKKRPHLTKHVKSLSVRTTSFEVGFAATITRFTNLTSLTIWLEHDFGRQLLVDPKVLRASLKATKKLYEVHLCFTAPRTPLFETVVACLSTLDDLVLHGEAKWSWRPFDFFAPSQKPMYAEHRPTTEVVRPLITNLTCHNIPEYSAQEVLRRIKGLKGFWLYDNQHNETAKRDPAKAAQDVIRTINNLISRHHITVEKCFIETTSKDLTSVWRRAVGLQYLMDWTECIALKEPVLPSPNLMMKLQQTFHQYGLNLPPRLRRLGITNIQCLRGPPRDWEHGNFWMLKYARLLTQSGLYPDLKLVEARHLFSRKENFVVQGDFWEEARWQKEEGCEDQPVYFGETMYVDRWVTDGVDSWGEWTRYEEPGVASYKFFRWPGDNDGEA